MDIKVLLTGFEIFEGITENPSEQIVAGLKDTVFPGIDLVTAILPVVYSKADEQIRSLIRYHGPDVVIMVGVAGKTDPIRLERVALNLDDAKIPDNEGVLKSGEAIFENAPNAYFSTLPLAALQNTLASAEFPVIISNHAGAYLCNHVFFAARHTVEELAPGTQVGFIHIPVHKEQAEESQLTLTDLRNAIKVCLRYFAKRE